MADFPLADLEIRVRAAIDRVAAARVRGRVVALGGLRVDVQGLTPLLSIGDRVTLEAPGAAPLAGEIVGVRGGSATVMTFGDLRGVGLGHTAVSPMPRRSSDLAVADTWLGRIIDPLGQPLDAAGPLASGGTGRPVHAQPPPPATRARLGPRLDLGVRTLDLFTTSRQGQRLGLFAGSGVGKSTLLGMLARFAACDVAVIGLIGERGREVREFVEDSLGPEGLARSVVIAATSDTPPLLRREAAYAAMTMAEHFRDQGRSVLLIVDSITRLCQALREIGLSADQPPVARGYPASMFAELPRLIERAGPGAPHPGGDGTAGHITALFSVLVEGDDMNEPVADTMRGILDGHIVLDRRIGERGRYPAVDVLRSLSRAMPECNSAAEGTLIARARGILARAEEMADIVRLGAYQPGGDAATDEALGLAPRIETLLAQSKAERAGLADSFAGLARILAAGMEG